MISSQANTIKELLPSTLTEDFSRSSTLLSTSTRMGLSSEYWLKTVLSWPLRKKRSPSSSSLLVNLASCTRLMITSWAQCLVSFQTPTTSSTTLDFNVKDTSTHSMNLFSLKSSLSSFAMNFTTTLSLAQADLSVLA